VLASCADQPSRLDPAIAAGSVASGGSGEAAAGSAAARRKPAPSDKPAGDGFDLQSALAKMAEMVGKPGRYEARRKSRHFDASKPHWGVLALSGSIVERETWSFLGGQGIELGAVVGRLRELAEDDQLTGVVLRVDALTISLPDAIELRAAFQDLRKAGKSIACHAENASNAAYLVLASCDRIGVAPLGDIAITGPAAMPIHIKPLLDKLGIQADFLHVGAYKGAAEPLTRDAPSKEMQETLGAILDRRYQTMVDVIADGRKLVPAEVKALIDIGLFPSDRAKAANLVDDVAEFEAFRDDATKAGPWTTLDLDPDKASQLAMIMRASRFIGAIPPDRPLVDHVAVVYAIGNIVDGRGDGVLGARQEIASHTLVPALHALTTDDAVKAVVLRIDSGGGSAQASELIWRAVAELKAKKPVVVSMSDVAASGGYYIASGATKIFALADTLTGSIGVVGGKLAPRDALAKIGVHTFPMGRGKHATILASLGPWNDDERRTIQGTMQSVYQVFVGRVADGRHKTPAQIQAIAEGRVWTGLKAKELGLVDEIGGLDAALAEARRLAKLDDGVAVEVYPPTPTLRDVVAGFGQVQAPFGITLDAMLAELAAVDPAVAHATEHLVRLVFSFRSSTVQAVAMLPVMQ
jgi:protease-4